LSHRTRNPNPSTWSCTNQGIRTARIRHHGSSACLAIILALFSLAGISCVSAQPQTERISGFIIGHAGFVFEDPFRALFMQDPLFTYTLYPLPPDLSNHDKQKLDRVYYPRTRRVLIDSYDLMILHDARIMHFTTDKIHDLDHAFRNAEMTGIMVFMGSFLWDWVFDPTILRDLVPISHHEAAKYAGFKVVFRRDRDPVFLPFLDLGIENVMGNAVAEMTAKQGATIWGDIVPQNQPWLVSWRPGGENPGMQWVLIQWYWDGWWSEKNNPYSLDVATNLIFHSLDRPLIRDIQARRQARRLFATLQAKKSVALSTLEWAESFGGNIQTLWNRVNQLELEMREAYADYYEQDYEGTILFLESMSPKVSEIASDAVRLKDEAMFWVFLSEWAIVASVSIASGAVIWTVMIRRRMYKAVEATRLTRI